MTLTVTDLFCGAGGSSIGIEAAGAQTVMAANHWQLAVDTHQANFPEADHDCADLSQVDPRRYPPTDLLWASPECTNHSQAKGVKRTTGKGDLWDLQTDDPTVERSRATMWDVVRFLEAKQIQGHPYQGAIVENVVDAAKWILYPAWRGAIEALGYDVHPVYLNSMFAWSAKATPAPQSRDRLYFVIVPHGVPVDTQICPAAWCPHCEADVAAVQTWKRPDNPWGRYRTQYVYTCPVGHGKLEPYALPAATAIDWSLIGERVGDRDRPLADNTIRRIENGLRKYAGTGPQLVPLSRLSDPRKVGSSINGPWPTQTGRADLGLLVPPTPEAFIASLRGGGSKGDSGVKPISAPLATFSADGFHHMLVVPPKLVMSYYRTGQAHPASEPICTQATHDTSAVVDPADQVDDCLFRMLAPHEIGAAMAFPGDYQITGSKRQRTRMYGQAVTPPAASLLVDRMAAALDSREEVAA